jgi:hypothetical protein
MCTTWNKFIKIYEANALYKSGFRQSKPIGWQMVWFSNEIYFLLSNESENQKKV